MKNIDKNIKLKVTNTSHKKQDKSPVNHDMQNTLISRTTYARARAMAMRAHGHISQIRKKGTN